MKTSRLPSIIAFGLCVSMLSQCAMYEHWLEGLAKAQNPEIMNSFPAILPMTPELPMTPQITHMPIVTPVQGRLLSENTYVFGGRTFLEQRLVVRESPLETELRVTQIQ